MRSQLRLADLKSRIPTGSKLMNVKIPAHITQAVDDLAKRIGTSKTEVIVALLNEGLAMVGKKRGR